MLFVAAIIPTYNAALYIKDTLLSLCRQSLPLSEIIVVDDGSRDNTTDIVLSLSKQYKSIRLKCLSVNNGQATARNYGLRATNAELVLFMDADDLAEPNLIEQEYLRLQELENQSPNQWVLCHTAYSIINSSSDQITPVVRWKQVYPEETLGYQFVRNNIITTSGVLARRDVALGVGGFDSTLRYSEDYDLWLKLASCGGFAYVDEPLVRVRRHLNNTSGRLSNMLEAEKAILFKYPLEVIKEAIFKRRLSWWENASDYVSILYRLNHWNEGLNIVRDIVNGKPNFAKGFFLLGLYYLHSKKWGEAMDCFNKTITLEPDNGAALNNLGALLALQGKTEDAFFFLAKANVLFPGYLDAGYNLENLKLKQINIDNIRFTWRELRHILTHYQNV